ncbi:hypothetical protein GCM10022255_011730 [Dactylosporangium darangshiense]|uniref:N-acetyltransferase domain-containing protein n=1 Tax=Dactylosporangium darangshiense TaxID=579108 RepID=A0ABP8CZA2_9ACTN
MRYGPDARGRLLHSSLDPQAMRCYQRAGFAESGEHAVTVEILRADQQRAIDVAHRAGLRLAPMGPLCRQGNTGPLAPYLPHADIL